MSAVDASTKIHLQDAGAGWPDITYRRGVPTVHNAEILNTLSDGSIDTRP